MRCFYFVQFFLHIEVTEVELLQISEDQSLLLVDHLHDHFDIMQTLLVFTVQQRTILPLNFVFLKMTVLFGDNFCFDLQFLREDILLKKVIINICLVLMLLSTFEAESHIACATRVIADVEQRLLVLRTG